MQRLEGYKAQAQRELEAATTPATLEVAKTKKTKDLRALLLEGGGRNARHRWLGQRYLEGIRHLQQQGQHLIIAHRGARRRPLRALRACPVGGSGVTYDVHCRRRDGPEEYEHQVQWR